MYSWPVIAPSAKALDTPNTSCRSEVFCSVFRKNEASFYEQRHSDPSLGRGCSRGRVTKLGLSGGDDNETATTERRAASISPWSLYIYVA